MDGTRASNRDVGSKDPGLTRQQMDFFSAHVGDETTHHVANNSNELNSYTIATKPPVPVTADWARTGGVEYAYVTHDSAWSGATGRDM